MKRIISIILILGITSTLSANPIITTAKKYLGVKYKYGGTTSKGIDCSGFTQNVFKKQGKKIPRTSNKQASCGVHISKKNLRVGDLVFFSDSRRSIGHVGIYIGKRKFIHASSGARKVTISRLDKKYYKQHYRGARRIR